MPTTERLQRDMRADSSYAEAQAVLDWRLSPKERAEANQRKRAGKIAMARLAALEIIRRDEERKAFDDSYISEPGTVQQRQSRTGVSRDFDVADMPMNLAEARVIARMSDESARRAPRVVSTQTGTYIDRASGTIGAFSLANPARMTTLDVARIADRAARYGARMASRADRKLTRAEYQDLKADCMGDVIARGKRLEIVDDEPDFIGPLTRRESVMKAFADNLPRGDALPKWRAIQRDDDPPDAPLTMWVDRWASLTTNYARRWVLARRDRMKADDDARERAEREGTTADDEITGAEATASEVLADPSLNLTNAERAAVLCALAPSRIVELAQVQEPPTTPNALMVQAHRGRKALAQRWPTRSEARRDLRSVPALVGDRALREALRTVEGTMSASAAIYRGVSLKWPSLREVAAEPYPYDDGAPWSGQTEWKTAPTS